MRVLRRCTKHWPKFWHWPKSNFTSCITRLQGSIHSNWVEVFSCSQFACHSLYWFHLSPGFYFVSKFNPTSNVHFQFHNLRVLISNFNKNGNNLPFSGFSIIIIDPLRGSVLLSIYHSVAWSHQLTVCVYLIFNLHSLCNLLSEYQYHFYLFIFGGFRHPFSPLFSALVWVPVSIFCNGSLHIQSIRSRDILKS